MTELLIPFTVGFLGSGHCLGMCGPLVTAFSLQQAKRPTENQPREPQFAHICLYHHAAFQAGRLFTYGILGGLAAGIFQFAHPNQFLQGMRGGVTLVGGGLLILFGLMLLQIIPFPAVLGSNRFLPRIVQEKIPALLGAKGIASRMVLGLLTGFLPCGLSWGMIVVAAVTQDIIHGFFVMISFGLGTVPALLAFGLFSSVLSMKLRLAGERLAAFAVFVMGVIMVIKGSAVFLN